MATAVNKPKAGGAKAAPGGDHKAALRGLSGLWSSTETPEGGAFASIPDGKYKAQVDNPVLRNGGKNKDVLQVSWPLRIIGPTHANRLVWANTNLDNEQGIGICKGYIDMMGVAVPDGIEELPDALAACHGKIVEINLRTKTNDQGTFQNTFINGLLEETENVGGTDETETPAQDAEVTLVDSTVNFEVEGGEVLTGTVTGQSGDALKVEVEGETYDLDVSQVTLAEAAPAEDGVEAPTEDTPPQYVEFEADYGDGQGAVKVRGTVQSIGTDGTLNVLDQQGNELSVPPEDAQTVDSLESTDGVEEAEVAPVAAKPKPKPKAPPAPPAKVAAKPASKAPPVHAKKSPPAAPAAKPKPAAAKPAPKPAPTAKKK